VAVVAVGVVGRIDVTAIEVQVVTVGVTIGSRRPVVTAVADIVQAPIVAIDVSGILRHPYQWGNHFTLKTWP